MALRDQPYLPLYIQDFLTDEKLIECSASATGIYIRIMCIMHKSEEYGVILLKQKDKQSSEQIKNFALKLAKNLPYNLSEIEAGILELISEGVLKIDVDKLVQKRMVKDNDISIKRSEAGKKGGDNNFANTKLKAKGKAKQQANTEYENDIENDIELNNKKGVKKNKEFIPPTQSEMIDYFIENGYSAELAKTAWNGYSAANWHDSQGNKVRNWKQKSQHVWFKEKNKEKTNISKAEINIGNGIKAIQELKLKYENEGE